MQKVGETRCQSKEISFGEEATDHNTELGMGLSALSIKTTEGCSWIPKLEPWGHPEGMSRSRCQSSPDTR